MRAGYPALMTVFRNANRWDTSNVEFADGIIKRYDKVNRTPAMQYIDYGLGVLSAVALARWQCADEIFFHHLSRALAMTNVLKAATKSKRIS
jgi:hypothetical protein